MSRENAAQPLAVSVVSDVVCPWCYIGKRRLEKAMAQSGVPIEIDWRPYQLDATLPPEGKDRKRYLADKFGSEERIARIHETLSAAGADEGIPFAFGKIRVSPNTLDAHRLIRRAGEEGGPEAQERVVEALFRAYFVEGRDIGSPDELAAIASEAGMDGISAGAFLASDESRDVVQREIEEAQRMGVTGVPTFILANRFAVVGAQPAEALAEAFAAVAVETGGHRPAA